MKYLSSLRPKGHLCWIGDQEEDTTYEGRIEDIPSESPEAHLPHSYGYDGTDSDDPPREARGKVHPKEHACQDGGSVTDGRLCPIEVLSDEPFDNDAGEDTDCEDDKRSEPKGCQRYETGWYEGEEDSVHVALHAISAVYVRGGRDD